MKNIYEKIYDYENLLKAAKQAVSGKRFKSGSARFYYNLEENLIELQNELVWHTYKVGKFFTFVRYEPKKRLINALPLKDRIVQIALCNVIEPEIDRRFIPDSFACRKNKGKFAAANRVSYFINKPKNKWFLKCDVHHFFASISAEILEAIIQKYYIQDREANDLIHCILYAGYSGCGIKIGNRFSQLAANIMLHELDFYAKEILHIQCFARYMDDFIILGSSKEQLKGYLTAIIAFLEQKLHLQLNSKTHIDKCAAGIDFVGYRIYPNRKVIKKQCLNRMRNVRKAWEKGKISDENFIKSLASRCGNVTGTASYKFYFNTCLKVIQVLIHRSEKLQTPIKSNI